jgi:Family of unknown function (DUF6519)/Abnormal spindle-like microcephaly-assoc'd, ASPM-SPD-2-Hydin
MSFDQSRSTSGPWSPWRDFLGVVMQQGRVQLDSDWNEWLAELVRRIQAGTLDILGLAGVPSTTPYGFKINAYVDTSSNSHITIGVGRIYVDGILAENHGPKSSAQWDPALAEWSGAPQIPGITEVDVDYTQQPYLPGVTLTSAQATGQQFLVYLDVWQREVTSIEAPDLVEKAVGIDTTGRLQTVWQVKLLSVGSVSGGVVCSTPDSAIAPWESVIQPSSSQLTNGLVQIASSGPCSLSPAAGYTGLENQLYRVEIHQGGAASPIPLASPTAATTATFKWSRENASVATVVTAISTVTNSVNNQASQLTVQSLGRDQVLGFSPGNWIEITDDVQELNDEAGELHQIDSVNAAAKTITLDSTVSTTNFPLPNGQTDPNRHTRIQRWDQAGTVYLSDGASVWVDLDAAVSTGVTAGSAGIPVPPSGTVLLLEDGVTVAFDPPGNSFNTGEFWTFAARTADGSVETLTKAPPAGILHHYCRLGMVNFSASPPAVSDCRELFPALANPCIHVSNVFVGSTPLSNNGTISIQALVKNGINVVFDSPLDPSIIATAGPNSPICFVTIDIPAAATAGGGFSPLILQATAGIGPSTTIKWTPTFATPAAQAALESQVSLTGPPLLGHLTLKGSFIWAQNNTSVHLNGVGDGRRSGDFDMWFWLISQPPVTLSATSLVFTAPQLVGTSTTQPVTLTNNTTAAITINSITITGDTGDFTQTNTCGASIAAGGTCTITVTFDPTAVGTRTAQINISESADSTPLGISLTGTGIQPQVSFSPTTVPAFPATIVGATSAAQTVTLTNSGTSQLTISAISTTGNFSQTSTCVSSGGSGTLQPGAQCAIQVKFSPTAAGSLTGTLVITHNAPGSPLTIGLSGTAVAGTPAIGVSFTSVNFGALTVGGTGDFTGTVTNTGTATLAITAVSVTGTSFSLNNSSTFSSSLPPSAQSVIGVKFSPATAGSFTGTLVISHNAAGSPLSIPLTGTGVLRIIKVTDGIKTSDVKAIDTVKVTDKIASTTIAKAAVEGESPSEGGTQKAFITPEERPSVTPSDTPSGEPDEEPKE